MNRELKSYPQGSLTAVYRDHGDDDVPPSLTYTPIVFAFRIRVCPYSDSYSHFGAGAGPAFISGQAARVSYKKRLARRDSVQSPVLLE